MTLLAALPRLRTNNPMGLYATLTFDHQTRAAWRDKIPAVVHPDGSTRLQTISRTSQQKVAVLLVDYEKLTGMPLLCNTSANYHGRGIFRMSQQLAQ